MFGLCLNYISHRILSKFCNCVMSLVCRLSLRGQFLLWLCFYRLRIWSLSVLHFCHGIVSEDNIY